MAVPKLRFRDGGEKEFPEWAHVTIGEVCATFKSGQGITSEKISKDGQFPVFGGNGLRGFTNAFTHDGLFILIGRQGALCGNINRSYGKAFISEHAIAVQANEASDTNWLGYKLDLMKLNRLSESSAQPGLSVNKLLKISIVTPSKSEQTKIANFLTAVDAKISQLTKKHELLTSYKKGVMQKIFSQELRFKDDDGREFPEWKLTIIGEIANKVIAGGTPSTLKKEYWGGNIRWMNSGELNLKLVAEVENRITQAGLENSSTKLIPKNCVLIGLAGQGKTRGTVAMNLVELCTNQSIAAILPNPKTFDSHYLCQNLEARYDELRSLSAGDGGRGGLNLQIIKSMEINLPCLQEQAKIANFLTAIDDKITNVKSKLEATKEYKQGLLQQMFV